MEYKKLILTKKNGVAYITLNRPEVLNALDQQLHVELHTAILQLWDDAEARVVVLTGAGRGFCAGRDVAMQEAGAKRTGKFVPPPKLEEPVNPDPWQIDLDMWTMPKPFIAAVNGVAVGGGLSLVLSCDIILASSEAKFGEFFIKKALVASGYTTFLLPRLIGMHKAKEMLFTGDLLSAKQAEEWGLVNHVYPAKDFMKNVTEFAEKIANGPSRAMGLMKMLVNEGQTMSMEAVGRAEVSADDLLLAAYFEDYKEGVTAHAEKRKPKFEGA
jgi:2-(1,2-epoxy-1,2-dihydrophenyl)acetyl-CoA isomerase